MQKLSFQAPDTEEFAELFTMSMMDCERYIDEVLVFNKLTTARQNFSHLFFLNPDKPDEIFESLRELEQEHIGQPYKSYETAMRTLLEEQYEIADTKDQDAVLSSYRLDMLGRTLIGLIIYQEYNPQDSKAMDFRRDVAGIRRELLKFLQQEGGIGEQQAIDKVVSFEKNVRQAVQDCMGVLEPTSLSQQSVASGVPR